MEPKSSAMHTRASGLFLRPHFATTCAVSGHFRVKIESKDASRHSCMSRTCQLLVPPKASHDLEPPPEEALSGKGDGAATGAGDAPRQLVDLTLQILQVGGHRGACKAAGVPLQGLLRGSQQEGKAPLFGVRNAGRHHEFRALLGLLAIT